MDLDAQVAKRGQPEEGIAGGLMGTSLGLIEIRGSLIRWINLLEHPGSRYASTTYTNVYVVPDVQVRSGGYLELRSARVRDASVYGRVVDLRWTANFVGTRVAAASGQGRDEEAESDLLRRVTEDVALKEGLIGLNEDITVRSVPNYWCWAISSGSYQEGGLGPKSRRLAPSREQWDCYQAIARHLLEFSEQGWEAKERKGKRGRSRKS